MEGAGVQLGWVLELVLGSCELPAAGSEGIEPELIFKLRAVVNKEPLGRGSFFALLRFLSALMRYDSRLGIVKSAVFVLKLIQTDYEGKKVRFPL